MKKLLIVLLFVLSVSLSFAQGRKFGVKSAQVEMKMETMGQEMLSTLYFDDYGEKLLNVMVLSTPMGDMKIGQLSLGKKTYQILYDQKIVQEIAEADPINFNEPTEEERTKHKMQEMGTEQFLGKECKVYTFEQEIPMQGSAKGKAWVWNGITLKSDISGGGASFNITATSVKENITIDPSKFEIPKF